MVQLPGGRPLQDQTGNELNTDLAHCFRIYNANELRLATSRTWSTSTYRQHPFKLIAVTSKGAGGTGKTTCAWSIAHHLALAGDNVLVLNTDGQPSVEERVLGKIVGASYNGDIDAFYEANGLGGHTVLQGLEGLLGYQPPEHNQPPENILPDVIGIDVARLSVPAGHSASAQAERQAGRIFLMRSSENISKWETELGSCAQMLRGFGSVAMGPFARTPGILYHMAQVYAYMLQAAWVIVDTGPGSGPLFMNVVMTSHGFIMPCGIDQKAKSNMQSLASKVELWTSDDPMSHYSIRNTVNSFPRNNFPTPQHTPKFLGVVYSRLGLRGRQFPYNQYAALADANSVLQQVLMPTLRQRGMLLPDAVYAAAAGAIPAEFDDFNIEQTKAQVIKVPAPVPGVTGIWVDFNQQGNMSERESVPVFFLQDEHLLKPKQDMLNTYISAVQQGQEPPFSIWDPIVYQKCESSERKRMTKKVQHLRRILDNTVAVLRTDLAAAAPAAAPPANAGDVMMAD